VIDFRYHLVSIIAIFFALAAGIALGAGPLKDQADQLIADQVRELSQSNSDLRQQVGQLEGALTFADDYAAATAPALLAGRLQGQRVAIVRLPGASEDLAAALGDSVTQAGGTLTGTLAIQQAWTDAPSAATLDSLAATLVTQGTTLPEGDGYTRGAVVLASAVAAPQPTEGDAAAAAASDAVLAAFTEAGMVSGELDGQADLVLSVAGDPFTGDEAERRSAAVLALVQALDAAGRGEVVSGPQRSAAEGGAVASVRADDRASQDVSTVDVADTASGQAATALALQEQQQGGAGQYGVVGSTDGAVPTSVLEPVPSS
jgi:hypothetical protein